MIGFKTPLQKRAERDIFSNDKEVAKKAMDILLGDADRLIEAHKNVSRYQLLLASRALDVAKLKP